MLYNYKDLRGDEYDQPDWKVFCTIVPSRDISRNLDSMEGKHYFFCSPSPQNNEQAKAPGDCAHMKLIGSFKWELGTELTYM